MQMITKKARRPWLGQETMVAMKQKTLKDVVIACMIG